MNVFDVLREKLKEKAEIYKREEEIQKSNPCYQRGVYGFKALGYENAIEIVNQVEQEYNNSLPKPISLESADYAHEASYIKGWNECLEKILENK